MKSRKREGGSASSSFELQVQRRKRGTKFARARERKGWRGDDAENLDRLADALRAPPILTETSLGPRCRPCCSVQPLTTSITGQKLRAGSARSTPPPTRIDSSVRSAASQML